MPTNTAQSSTAISLVRWGVTIQLAGLLWGMVVQMTPYPRLALTAHIQFMVQGVMILVAGILLNQMSLIEIGAVQSRIVYWGLGCAWVVLAADCVNAFWGAKDISPIAAKFAGAEGAVAWREHIMTAAHVLPGLGFIAALGVLMSGVFAKSRDLKIKE